MIKKCVKITMFFLLVFELNIKASSSGGSVPSKVGVFLERNTKSTLKVDYQITNENGTKVICLTSDSLVVLHYYNQDNKWEKSIVEAERWTKFFYPSCEDSTKVSTK